MTVVRDDSWGKSGVRLVTLHRRGEWFDIADLLVTTMLTGDTAEVYESGSNAKILTTDAQQNAVYALAAQEPPLAPEAFALNVASYFVSSDNAVTGAAVDIEQRGWQRVDIGGVPATHSFQGAGADLRIARAEVSGATRRISAGIHGLALLNATGSEFLGFFRDRYTLGQGAADRILATELAADWSYAVTDADFNAIYLSVRERLIATFASVYSRSIQFSMKAMAESVLEAHSTIESITLTFPNIHHNLVDLSPFGLENDRTVFITAQSPHSLIRATFDR